MKKFISALTCIAMLAGLGAVGVSADDTALLTTEATVEAAEDTAEAVVDEATVEAPVFTVELTPYAVDATVKALVLGDSNACGYGLETYDPTAAGVTAGSFADVAFAEVLRANQTVAMFAAPGATADDVLDLFVNEEKAALTAAAVAQAKYILVNVAGNDLLAALAATVAAIPMPIVDDVDTIDAAEAVDVLDVLDPAVIYADAIATITATLGETAAVTAEKVATIAAAINEINPDAKVIVANIPAVDVTAYIANTELAALIAPVATEVIAVYDVALAAAGVEVFDVNAAIADIEAPFQADGIHFTADAHAAIGAGASTEYVKFVKAEKTKTMLHVMSGFIG